MIKANPDYKPVFKKEWTWLEVKGVEAAIQEYFKENHRIKNSIDYFGIPYTSSSSFAMVSNTNSPFEIEPGIKLEYFAVTENNMLIAVGWDSKENESYYFVEEE